MDAYACCNDAKARLYFSIFDFVIRNVTNLFLFEQRLYTNLTFAAAMLNNFELFFPVSFFSCERI